jgi:hypothetical protein
LYNQKTTLITTRNRNNKQAATSVADEDLNLSIAIAQSVESLRPGGTAPLQLRDLDTPSGLDNVGNTCYFNAVLQVYFHTEPVRRAVLAWREPERRPATPVRAVVDCDAAGPPAAESSGSPTAESSIRMVAALQRLFADMLLSERASADPTAVLAELTHAAGQKVTVGKQEDVSEFNWLFLERLDEGLRAGAAAAARAGGSSAIVGGNALVGGGSLLPPLSSSDAMAVSPEPPVPSSSSMAAEAPPSSMATEAPPSLVRTLYYGAQAQVISARPRAPSPSSQAPSPVIPLAGADDAPGRRLMKRSVTMQEIGQIILDVPEEDQGRWGGFGF